ncbi:MAG: hypothetical protein ACYDCK_10300 [Thermoplasmatota archaeon]
MANRKRRRSKGAGGTAAVAVVFLLLVVSLAAFAYQSWVGTSPASPSAAFAPARVADVLAGSFVNGANVTLEETTVVGVENASHAPSEGAWKTPSFVRLQADDGSVLVATFSTESATALQHKKQVGVPAPGMRIVAQGEVRHASSGVWGLAVVDRWGTRTHDGKTVSVSDVAAGRVAEGRYVWVSPARVTFVRHESDGDWHVKLTEGNDTVVTEITPPYASDLARPALGDVLAPWGMVLFDATHGWWELHPIQCLDAARCAPPAAAGFGGLGGGED